MTRVIDVVGTVVQERETTFPKIADHGDDYLIAPRGHSEAHQLSGVKRERTLHWDRDSVVLVVRSCRPTKPPKKYWKNIH